MIRKKRHQEYNMVQLCGYGKNYMANNTYLPNPNALTATLPSSQQQFLVPAALRNLIC